jgi:hypothetical protein
MKSLLFIVLSISFSFAQVKPLHTQSIKSTVVNVYVDRPGDLYLQFSSGTIQKFDINGKLVDEFDPQQKITVFDPRDGARAFTYSQKSRWYSFAYFGSLNKTPLKEEYAIDPLLVCSSGDKNLWILDQADYSLKRINTDRSTVDVEVYLPQTLHTNQLSILSFREYQGFLFLLDERSGIYIFSTMGKLLKHLKGDSISYFNFLGEELYYLQNNTLIFYNLFDTTTRQLEVDPTLQFMLVTDERIYSIYHDRVDFYVVNP